LKDNLGHTTKIRFSDLNTQVKFPASLFTFKPPKNVDVIDETHKK
jgi:outer membrane lipoprotein-sorting protein